MKVTCTRSELLQLIIVLLCYSLPCKLFFMILIDSILLLRCNLVLPLVSSSKCRENLQLHISEGCVLQALISDMVAISTEEACRLPLEDLLCTITSEYKFNNINLGEISIVQ